MSHHDHNMKESISAILELQRAGRSIAVVTDAGTPGISDPGSHLAAALVRENGAVLHPIPGMANRLIQRPSVFLLLSSVGI